MHSIDEYTLAAFLDGTLTSARRQEIRAYLAKNADARDLLKMAYEALEAAEEPALFDQPELAETAPMPPASQGLPMPVGPRSNKQERDSDREARRGRAKPLALRLVPRATIALVVAASAFFLWSPKAQLEAETSAPVLRSAPGATDLERIELVVHVSTPALRFRWNEIPNAHEYRLNVVDLQSFRVVKRHTTKENSLDTNNPFVEELRKTLDSERVYGLSINAVDVRHRGIVDSDLIHFTLDAE
ncbi:MAG: hypothetical protein ACR2GR_10645 [Rhodothermales bacterium]